MEPEITVSTTVDVAWLQGQTKGSADVEIEFGGLAASTPVHIGFAVQQLAQARAAAEVLASFFLLLIRDTAVRANDEDYEVSLGDSGSAVTFEVHANLRPVTAFPFTVAVSEDCNTRSDAADEAAATAIDAIARRVARTRVREASRAGKLDDADVTAKALTETRLAHRVAASAETHFARGGALWTRAGDVARAGARE